MPRRSLSPKSRHQRGERCGADPCVAKAIVSGPGRAKITFAVGDLHGMVCTPRKGHNGAMNTELTRTALLVCDVQTVIVEPAPESFFVATAVPWTRRTRPGSK